MEPVTMPPPTVAPSRLRRRLRTALLITGLALAAVVVVGWRFAVHQWHAAQAALEDDRPAEARGRLEVCLRAWPYSPEVRLAAARAARQTLDLAAAESHLDRARQLQGGSSEAIQIELLLLRVQAGEMDEVAPTLFDAVEAGNPQAPLILETLARAYMHRLRYKVAWACLDRLIKLKPDSAKAYQWRAWTLERLSNHKAAMADYLKVLELAPDQVDARLRVAEMLLDDKQAPEAVPHLERLIRQQPNHPTVQARLGACRLLEGRLDEARPLLEAAAEKLPRDPALAVALANLDIQEGRGEAAERRLRTFLAAEPSDTEALFVLAAALRVQGKTAEADEAMKEHERKAKVVEETNDLLTNKADDPKAGPDDYAKIGQLLLEIGRDKLGVYWLERALERNPAHPAAHRALAQYYERKGDAAQALAHRRQFREPDPPAAPAPPRR